MNKIERLLAALKNEQCLTAKDMVAEFGFYTVNAARAAVADLRASGINIIRNRDNVYFMAD